MYEFAVLLLAGLVTAKLVDLVRHATKDVPKAGSLLIAAAVGIGLAYLLDFSIFAAWGVGVRAETIGVIVTGLVLAGVAGVWHEAIELMRERAHRYHGEATEIEARLRSAA